MPYIVVASELPELTHDSLRAARIAAQRRAKRRNVRQAIVEQATGKVVLRFDGHGKSMPVERAVCPECGPSPGCEMAVPRQDGP
jgi:hypothetical protein